MMPQKLSPHFDSYALETSAAGKLVTLSSDGTCTTHRARDTRSDQHVIVRIFSERLLADDSVQQEFVDHAKLLIELDHPSITRIIDTGQHADQFFYVLEDPGGHTVEESIEASGPFEVPYALKLHLQISEALLAVRTKPGLLSRVWPRSLMVTGDGEAAQIHLLAQNLVAPSEEEEQPEFLAPEILAGHQDTSQASLYSIGATLYYMLTGKPPYLTGLPVEDLLELKSKRLPDLAMLPESAPVTLLRQVLDADPRNRPKSLMEWDRALQRFIRFTPAETRRAELSSPAPKTPESTTEPAPPSFIPFGKSENTAAQTGTTISSTRDPELDKAKIHTQRLSVELTKRVQKELALTDQLKTLESELQEERNRVRELTSSQALPNADELDRLRVENSKTDGEWEEIQKARKNLEKEQHEFLKKTQRFTVRQLESKKDSSASEGAPDLTGTQRVASKQRLFRLSRKAKEKLATKPESHPESSPPANESTKKPAPSTNKTARQTLEGSTTSRPHTKPIPERSDSKVVTFKNPKAAEPPAIPNTPASASQEKAPAKPQNAISETTKPKEQTSSQRLIARATAQQPIVTSKPIAPNKPPDVRKKAPAPQYEPLPGAWVALAILAAVVALGLFLAYRTFFSRSDHYLMGALNDDASPTVVNIRPPLEPGPFEPLTIPAKKDTLASSDLESISIKPVAPSSSTTPKPTREASVNNDLRSDMKAHSNFLLIQDEEWAELLHGLKIMDLQTEKYTEDELAKIHKKLHDGLERKAQLRKDSEKDLHSDPEFKKLFDYVKALVPEEPSALN